MRRLIVSILASAALAGSAVAQDAERGLRDLAACRIDDGQVLLSFKFEASPCWETTGPVVSDGGDDPAGSSVAVGTIMVGEVCTMNIVIAEFDEAISLPSPANALTVSLTAPDGNAIGEDTVAIAEPHEGCEAPETDE